MAVQLLGFGTSTAGDMGSIPGWGTKILHAAERDQKKYYILIDLSMS